MTLVPGGGGGWRATALLRHRFRRTARFLTTVTIALIGVLVVIGLLLAWRDYTGRRTAVLDDARLRARAAAADADRFLRDRIEALTLIATSPSVEVGDRSGMQAYFQLLADKPGYARLSWYDLTGIRRASNLPDPPSGPLVVSERTYFQTVVATGQPYVDAAVISLQDQSPIIVIAVPTFDATHRVSGVLVNPITLDVLEQNLATFQRSQAKVLVIDRDNQLIVDAVPGNGFQPVANPAVVARERALGNGTFADVTGPRGTPGRLLGFDLAPTGDWLVLISQSADTAFAPARNAFITELFGLLGLVVIGIGGGLRLSRRLRREAAVQQQAEDAAIRLAAIVESSDDAIVGITTDGLVTTWNPSATRIFGLDAPQGLGRPLWTLVAPERAGQLRVLLAGVGSGRGVQQYETVGVRGDGTRFDVSLTLSPTRTSTLEEGGSVIARDVTAHKQLEMEREQLLQREHAARAEAEAANRAKDEFLSVLSHELRTPLTAIVAGAQLLQRRRGTDPDVAEMAATIERSSRVQMKLINDLLDVSRVMSGKLQLEREQLSLPDLVEVGVESLRPQADAKGVTLESRVDPSVGNVFGDPERLQQVLANLLGNALKFTPAGGRITVALGREGAEARLVVRDTGVGISPDFLPHVFERFRQSDASSQRAYGGLGLGLAIVQTLVEMHGGRVAAASEGEGRGATFTVWLPLLEPRQAGTGPADRQPAGVAGSDACRLMGRRLVLVEDDAASRDLLQQTLEAEGAQVVAVPGSAAGLAALDRQLPDVVLCDIGLPGEDGYAFVRRLRLRSRTAGGDLPAIALTAYASPEDRERALAAGFSAHVSKPVDADGLVAAIAAALATAAAGAVRDEPSLPPGR
jgi:PAS domain S-box-containing protein